MPQWVLIYSGIRKRELRSLVIIRQVQKLDMFFNWWVMSPDIPEVQMYQDFTDHGRFQFTAAFMSKQPLNRYDRLVIVYAATARGR